MNEAQKTVDNIQIGITSLIDMLNQEVDLKDDVLPFLKPTLNKISQMAHHKMDFENLYELFQITTNYLPRTVQSYCGLPVEYRNTKIIKDSQTARDLLVADIALLKSQVTSIENKIFAEIETSIKVNNKVIKEKFTPQLQLATEVEKDEGQKFINQFDIKKYINNPNNYDVFHKNLQLTTNKFNNANKTQEILSTASIKGKGFIEITGSFIYSKFKTLKVILSKLTIPTLIVISVIGFLSLPYFAERGSILRTHTYEQLDSMYAVLKNHSLSSQQLLELKNKNEALLIDNSDYRKERVQYDFKNNIISMNVFNYSKDACEKMINYQKDKLQNTQLEINNIIVSNSNNKQFNNNAELCYLEDNSLKISFDQQKIYKPQ